MKILFVRSSLMGSRFIRWGLGEDVSHVVVLFPRLNVAYHSYLTGILTTDRDHLAKTYEVVHELNYQMSEETETLAIQLFHARLPREKGYDYPAFAYFIFRAILKKFFRVPFPKINLWQQKKGFLCTEIGQLLSPILIDISCTDIFAGDVDYSMVTPYGLFKMLEGSFPAIFCRIIDDAPER